MHSQFFYPLLLSWVYENGFANFYQGLSPEKKLENQTGVGSVRRVFLCRLCDGAPQIAGQNHAKQCNAAMLRSGANL
jgi:hypothetical protein